MARLKHPINQGGFVSLQIVSFANVRVKGTMV